MASVTALTASPTSVAPHGGTTILMPTVVNPAGTFTGTVYDDQGGSASVSVQINAEGLTYSVDPAKKGLPGFIVCQLSTGAGASVAVAPDGVSFIATAT